ncbi:MAG: DNA methyltransferase [Thiotrichaceae bacterium]|nr:MAG: DNA methyltransferase [Thiotrichaceae bacterium]
MGRAFAASIQKEREVVFNQNYLAKCQVSTPHNVAEWAWSKVNEFRPEKVSKVLDLGCGDGRFSIYGDFENYNGIEIDPKHERIQNLPANVKINHDCALLTQFELHDLCIGNPPYVRHHDMDSTWRDIIANQLSETSGITIDRRANAYLYFILKALLSTKRDGIVALIVPFEWVARPSATWLRDFISSNGWSVHSYKLSDSTFPRVLTTSSLSIIDKSTTSSKWFYYRVNDDFTVTTIKSPSESSCKVLKYSKRHKDLFANRGLSPGTQKIFCLTEFDRLHNKLKIGRDVSPCVTSMKALKTDVKILTKKVFKESYVKSGARCWLIRSDKPLSKELKIYLDCVHEDERNTSTCNNREIWYKYAYPDTAQLLLSTGFIAKAPQVIENAIGAKAVGSVAGIYMAKPLPMRKIANYIRNYNFENRIVKHAGKLRKIEINQLNTVLQYALSNFRSQ